MVELRAAISPTVPELAASAVPEKPPLVADFRLLDMVVWTAMDDRLAIRAGLPPKWIDRAVGAHIPYDAVAPEPVLFRQRPALRDVLAPAAEGNS
jgi:hypothetical protein